MVTLTHILFSRLKPWTDFFVIKIFSIQSKKKKVYSKADHTDPKDETFLFPVNLKQFES